MLCAIGRDYRLELRAKSPLLFTPRFSEVIRNVEGVVSRFNGFIPKIHIAETVETVFVITLRSITWLKPGVNERRHLIPPLPPPLLTRLQCRFNFHGTQAAGLLARQRRAYPVKRRAE